MKRKETRHGMSCVACMCYPVAKAERALPGSPNTSEIIQ